jgi:branched-chain amino acid transport system substrate-binding protein
MQAKSLWKFAVAGALTAVLGTSAVDRTYAADPIKVGVVGAKTGPQAGGAAVSHYPNFQLWAHNVNARGGLKLKEGQRKIEIIEYDDRTQPAETIKAVERLATVDKADLIMAAYGTGFNLAAAPIFDKYGYPQLTVAALTDKIDELTQRYKGIFFFIGNTSAYAESVADVLKQLNAEGKIGKRVAVVNVADTFGIELANAGREAFKKAGLEIVFDRSYPLGTQDLAPVIKSVKAASPDAFVAWSYPPDTFALAEQAKIEGLNVKVYYSAVATAFPGFAQKFGSSAENILGAGGVSYTPAIKKYMEDHEKVTGVKPDYWASSVYYAMLEVLEQSIEAVGTLDRKAITDYIKSHTFQTLIGEVDIRSQSRKNFWTVGQWQNGVFEAVKGVKMPEGKPIRMKTGW